MAKQTVSTSAIRRSTIMGLVLFGVFAFLLLRILIIQTINFKTYQQKVIDQITTQSPVSADRGKIYDRNGNVLATNVTTYRVFISPSGIKSQTDESGTDYYTVVAKGLSDILEVDYNFVHTQATGYTQYLDRTIKRKVHEEQADLVREYIAEHGLEDMIYLEAQSTRYYPGDTLGSHMIGFTSSDGVGLYGLEYQYDEYLRGTDGYYILARDANGNEMPLEYASYINAIDGYNLTTTIDASVQSYLEEQLAKTVKDHDVKNRATGIVMDVNTGAILAMATSSPFDLNDPWKLSEESQKIMDQSGFSEGSDEYNALLSKTLTETWSNKAVAESYIPGSTFKIITSAMAMEEKKVNLTETQNCPGYRKVLGITIRCHKVQGHGTLLFEQGLQQSCNVWFMELGSRVGIDNYVQYTKAFGYREKTGIDLPGEGNSIFISEMSELDLAIYAFGQNFNVTPIQHITAISSVANGGTLLAPYVVEKITDNAGNVIYSHKKEVKRETLSEDVCREISRILEEGVATDGGAKNAYVAGYKVAAKTGTSEKKGVGATEDMYICSTVAYAPANDPQVAIIIIVDEPTKGSLYGSTVAAPYVGDALEKILPQLGIKAEYTESELKKLAYTVGNYRSWSVAEAVADLKADDITVEVVGSGSTVTSQVPSGGKKIEIVSGARGIVYLYTDGVKAEDEVIVPDFTGLTPMSANGRVIQCGLNLKIEGTNNHLTSDDVVVFEQSIPAGTTVPKGQVITLTFRYMGADDTEVPDFDQ